MKKRFMAFLATLPLILGLAVVIPIMTASPAQAGLPATGTHTVKFQCDQGLYHSTLEFTYNITYVDISPFNDYRYDWQLLEATYTGTPGMDPVRGPQVTIGTTAGGWLNATRGGSDHSSKMVFGPGEAQSPTSTNTASTGSNGLPWTTFRVQNNPAQGPNMSLRVYWHDRAGNPENADNCAYIMDLGFPDGPHDGESVTGDKTCTTLDGTASAAVRYDIVDLGGDTFSFRILELWSNQGDADILDITLEDSAGYLIDVGLAGGVILYDDWPSPLHIVHDSGPGAFFVQKNFEATYGGITPNLRFSFGSINGPYDCTTSVDLMDRWQSEDTYYNTVVVPFDDCSGGDPGELVVTSYWDLNSNGDKVKLNRVVIFNDSAATLKMPLAGSGDSAHNPIYQRGIFGTEEITYMDASAGTSQRNWNPGVTRNLSIGLASHWTPVAQVPLDIESAAPSDIRITQPPQVGAVSMDFVAYTSLGVECPNGFTLYDVTASSDL